jgi:NAD(P)-dependent dehydrogenase (short-subunit alcohol dehydrogenase family)
MELSLKDKVAVVTGASKGIGLAVVKALPSTAAVTRSVTGRWQDDPHLDSGLPSGRFSAYWKRACANAGCARAGYASRVIERHEVLEEGR